VVLGDVIDRRGAVQVADGLAVVGELGEVLSVVGVLDPGRDAEISAAPAGVFGVRRSVVVPNISWKLGSAASIQVRGSDGV